MKLPLVSIILPFHNAENTLARAVTSLLGQTYKNTEIILVNNCSTDSSAAIATDFSNSSENICLIDEPKKGVVHASASGLRHANGEFICRMDADDIALPEKVEKQVLFLQKDPNLAAISCLVENIQSQEIKGDGISYYVDWVNTIISSEEIALNRFIESPIINPTIMFRRITIEQYGFYTDGDYPEDYELWLRYLAAGLEIGKIPEVLFRWHDSPNRLTRTHSKYSVAAFAAVKAKYVAKIIKSELPQKETIAVWGAGKVARANASHLFQYGIEIGFYIDISANEATNTISYKHLKFDRKTFILSYVGNRGAREKIRKHLSSLGYCEGKDFLCVS